MMKNIKMWHKVIQNQLEISREVVICLNGFIIEKFFYLIRVVWAFKNKWIVVSIFRRQLQNVSKKGWKLHLNLCTRKWLRPYRNLATSLISWGLYTLNVLLGLGLINLRICFLKALTDSEFRILLSSLFHSITVDGKKEFRKYSCLTLNKGMLLWFLVAHVDKTLGIILKR